MIDQDTLTLTIMLSVFAITGISILVAWIPIWVHNRRTKGMNNEELLKYFQSRHCGFHPDMTLTISGECGRCILDRQSRHGVEQA